ncbi:hypothetical protein PVK06_012233 [Gossypium arboreum]|uniref:Uncharacterized protein n=1 Tax=Gossypium arboreum TaxID=29729 RepID=A0ABR0QB59_GOSAR|nr:hypothetical protein PVK06_012233 [Gossypium arboreum]
MGDAGISIGVTSPFYVALRDLVGWVSGNKVLCIPLTWDAHDDTMVCGEKATATKTLEHIFCDCPSIAGNTMADLLAKERLKAGLDFYLCGCVPDFVQRTMEADRRVVLRGVIGVLADFLVGLGQLWCHICDSCMWING